MLYEPARAVKQRVPQVEFVVKQSVPQVEFVVKQRDNCLGRVVCTGKPRAVEQRAQLRMFDAGWRRSRGA